MAFIYPAQNVLWFWFDKATRRVFHGIPDDTHRKVESLQLLEFPFSGLEYFIVPSKLQKEIYCNQSFANQMLSLEERTLHIGDSDYEFLIKPESKEHLNRLNELRLSLGTNAIIVHAHHFAKEPTLAVDNLLTCLPGAEIRVENNGFDNRWGADPKNIEKLLREYSELTFCLDIAHVHDFAELSLDDFFSNDLLMSRLSEVHFSYSTHLLDKDPYIDAGFPGYGPFHALFSVLGLRPAPETLDIIQQVPIVVEGVVPKEDRNLEFLKQEIEIAKGNL